MKRSVRIFIEGGSTGRAEDSDFRRGWKKLFQQLHELARAHGYTSLEVVRGKARSNTFEQFVSSQKAFPSDRCFLLVDAEGPVGPQENVWDVVMRREGDAWVKPPWARDDDLYLIVQSVETWLLTDPDALAKHFKRGFDRSKLPATNLEGRSKGEVEQALAAATRNCQRGVYRHPDATQIIGIVDPRRVQTLHHGRRIFDNLTRLITGENIAA